MDEDGYVWYEGRADDVIISAGYRIGPFEVESACLEHRRSPRRPPSPRRTSGAATSSRRSSCSPPGTRAPRSSPRRSRRSSATACRRTPTRGMIEFVDALPKTLTGKIRRIELRERDAALRCARRRPGRGARRGSLERGSVTWSMCRTPRRGRGGPAVIWACVSSGDGAVARVALASGAQLDQLHRLARVEVEDEADPVAEAERVRRGLVQAGVGEPLELDARALERTAVLDRRCRPARPARGCPRRGRASATATGRSASGGAGGHGRRRSRRRSRIGSGAPRTRGRGGGGGCARSPTRSAAAGARTGATERRDATGDERPRQRRRPASNRSAAGGRPRRPRRGAARRTPRIRPPPRRRAPRAGLDPQAPGPRSPALRAPPGREIHSPPRSGRSIRRQEARDRSASARAGSCSPISCCLGQRVCGQVEDRAARRSGPVAWSPSARAVEAGSRPRSRSRALALIARACAAGRLVLGTGELLIGPPDHPWQRAGVDPEDSSIAARYGAPRRSSR